MVVLWSFDPTSELAGVLIYSFAALFICMFYFKIIGWLDSPSFSLYQNLGLRTVELSRKGLHFGIPKIAPHWKMRLWLEGAIVVIVVTDILSIVVYPPAYTHGWFYSVFMYRQIPSGAHGSSYVLVLSLILIATLKWDDALKGIIYGGLMVFIHEAIWFPFYYLTNWSDLNVPLDMGFVLWIVSMFVIARRKYQIRISLNSLTPYALFLIGWFAIGFPITVKNTSRIFFETQFYGDPLVESIEVISWMVIFGIFLWNLKINEPHGWKWIESIKLSNSLKKIPPVIQARASQRNRFTHILSFLVIGILIVSLVVAFPRAMAYTVPNTCRSEAQNSTSAACNLTIGNVGDLLIGQTQVQDAQSAGHTEIHVNSVVGGGTWALAKAQSLSVGANCQAGNCFDDEIWYAVATTSGTVSVQFTYSQNFGAAGAQIQVEDVHSLPGSGLAGTSSFTCSSSCGTSFSTSGSVTIDSGNIPVGSIWTSCQASNILTPGANYDLYSPLSLFEGASEYGHAASPPTGSTNFPFTCGAAQNTIIVVGAVFGIVPTVTVTTVVPPSAFSLNYWLYPILFLGMYDVFFLVEGFIAKVSTKGLTYLLISGFVIGSLLAVIMGMIDFELPIITLIGFFVYIFRIKK